MLYFVSIVIALTAMKINLPLFYVFTNALAWEITIGIGVALGLGLDYVSKNAEKWL